MSRLRFALAQGVLLSDALTALRAVGLDVSRLGEDRRLVVPSGDVEFVLARPSDIATYVERGAADLGIVGKDVLMESAARVLELADLRFGACRFVVAAPRDRVRDQRAAAAPRAVRVGLATGARALSRVARAGRTA